MVQDKLRAIQLRRHLSSAQAYAGDIFDAAALDEARYQLENTADHLPFLPLPRQRQNDLAHLRKIGGEACSQWSTAT